MFTQRSVGRKIRRPEKPPASGDVAPTSVSTQLFLFLSSLLPLDTTATGSQSALCASRHVSRSSGPLLPVYSLKLNESAHLHVLFWVLILPVVPLLQRMDSESMRYRPAGHWPEDFDREQDTGTSSGLNAGSTAPPAENFAAESSQPRPKTYPPRQCRICLETVYPTFHPGAENQNIPSFLRSKPKVTYESSDPELGRLLRPCKCKGSARYVHEQCLTLWRHADPSYGKRNYWQCPTCGFQYRLDRMLVGQWISSPYLQMALTISILLFIVFCLGFVADPIINLYLDPIDTMISPFLPEFPDDEVPVRAVPHAEQPTSWAEHFTKGLASLGFLSFLKTLLALSPWGWWNARQAGFLPGRGGRAATGRDRLNSVSWIVIVLGVLTFLAVCLPLSSSNTPLLISGRHCTKGLRQLSR